MWVGLVFPGPSAAPWFIQLETGAIHQTPYPTTAHTIVWRVHSPSDIITNLISCTKPTGAVKISNSIWREECSTTPVCRTASTSWSAPTLPGVIILPSSSGIVKVTPHPPPPITLPPLKVPTSVVSPQRPPPRFFSGVGNRIYDLPSWSMDLNGMQIISILYHMYPYRLTLWLWSPPITISSTIASEMRKITFPRVSLLL